MTKNITNYSMTGINPALSTKQFQNNGVGDFETPRIWWEIMGAGPCLDAPEHLSQGSCHNHWAVQGYVHREPTDTEQ